ncbi:hypothetical protein [Senegalia massiliensis]|uniref:Uncharacterized protein n=1 Tax=Senegalia massiliensis TaxID=1720316 RepID=A0A845R1T8_9CLOT|nr:hypothetical protein [Senegalia massiliensis]NBI08380.1 hypothetical protein [Senegalia massiliensis]
MYKNNEIYYPKERFLNLNFEKIKKYITHYDYLFKDYGSIILIQNSEIAISINHIGKTVFFYNGIEESKKEDYISIIEKVFSYETKEFKLIRKH